MLKNKKLKLKGVGDMCSRSRSAVMFQSDLTEFETELLEAIGDNSDNDVFETELAEEAM